MLRPVGEHDLDIFTALLTCPVTTRYLPGGKPFGAEYINRYLANRIKHWSKGYGTFIVSLASDPSVKIGYAGVEEITDTAFSDIRYGLLEHYQGAGYAFEAAQAVLNFTFSSELLSTIYGVAVAENQASLRLLNKLGMHSCATRLYDAEGLLSFSIQGRC